MVLFLPENEMHEIGLLFFHYLIKSLGFQTYYLGQYVPLADLEKSVERLQPDYMIASISYSSSEKHLNKFLAELNRRFDPIQIYLTGRPVADKGISEHSNLHFFKNASQLREEFAAL